MDIVHELVKKIVMIIPIILVIALFFWVAQKFLPNVHFKNLITFNDVLPPPTNSGVLKAPQAPSEDNFNNAYTYNVNNASNDTSHNNPLGEPSVLYYSSQSLNPLYIRNVTVKRYSSIYSGMIIRGEAKRSFFAFGTFPVFIEDLQKNIYSTQARAIDPWQAGEWVKFEIYLGKLNQKNQCSLVFKNANTTGNQKLDIYTSLPVYCIH